MKAESCREDAASKTRLPKSVIFFQEIYCLEDSVLFPQEDMGQPQLLLHAECRTGVPEYRTSGQGPSCASALGVTSDCTPAHAPHQHCATTPTIMVVIFLLWLIFKDSAGTFPCWPTPVKWYMSLCFVPMERRGVQLGDWWEQVLCPWSNPTKQRMLVQGKGKSAPHPAGDQLQVAQKCKQHITLLLSFSFLFFTDLTHTHTHTHTHARTRAHTLYF